MPGYAQMPQGPELGGAPPRALVEKDTSTETTTAGQGIAPWSLLAQAQTGNAELAGALQTGTLSQAGPTLAPAAPQGGQTTPAVPAADNSAHLALGPETRGGFVARALQAMGRGDAVEAVLNSGRFNEPITRAEAASVSTRLLDLGTALEGNPGVFDDVGLDHWAAASIYRARETGILAGTGDNEFRPDVALKGEHASTILQRIGDPKSRSPFNRAAAVSASQQSRGNGSGGSGGESQAVAERVAKGLADYEGTAPDQIHYDSGIVNWGVGSNTGSHIAKLLDTYEKYATDEQRNEELYEHFGGRAGFERIRERFRTQGQDASLSKAETAMLQSLGRDKDLVQAQYIKAAEDAKGYINAIGRFNPPYPFADSEGRISEVSAHVFAAAGHQAGSPGEVYREVIDDIGVGAASKMSEAEFLRLIRNKIVSWVQPRYRVGVTNRYNGLFDQYGSSDAKYDFRGDKPTPSMEGQVSAGRSGTAGAEVEVVDSKGKVFKTVTGQSGFFRVEGEMAPGAVTVRSGGVTTNGTVSQGAPGWTSLRTDGTTVPTGPTGPGQQGQQGTQQGSPTQGPGPSAPPKREIPAEDQPYYSEISNLFDLAIDGKLNDASTGAATTASRYRAEHGLKPGDPADVTTALGQVWQVGDSLSRAQRSLTSGDHGTAKTAAHNAAQQARALLASGAITKENADRIIQAAGGWWSTADKASREGVKPEDTNPDRKQQPSQQPTQQPTQQGQGQAKHTPTIDQHRLPHERSWAFCGIATMIGVLRASGKEVDASSAASLNQLSRDIYIPGSGTSGAGMASRMREFGLKDARFTQSGRTSDVVALLDKGKPVPLGVDSIGGEVVSLPRSSARYPGLKQGDDHYHRFGASGHWVTVVGYEGTPDKPTHYLVNDPDTGARLRMSASEFARHSAAQNGLWMVSH